MGVFIVRGKGGVYINNQPATRCQITGDGRDQKDERMTKQHNTSKAHNAGNNTIDEATPGKLEPDWMSPASALVSQVNAHGNWSRSTAMLDPWLSTTDPLWINPLYEECFTGVFQSKRSPLCQCK